MPPLLKGLSRIDLTNCSEDEARRRLINGLAMPALLVANGKTPLAHCHHTAIYQPREQAAA